MTKRDNGSGFGNAPGPDPVRDLAGIGLGPFNLSLAALADAVPGLDAVFLDRQPEFRWHPGLLLEGARLQVPFLADLVTMVDPTSRWSFLNYLREHDRMFPFFFAERFHVPRTEYEHYCHWVAHSLPSCHFDA
ncbi:SidA/IucD/PvdA family monooxygenase, partial [Crossiella equi]